MYYIVRTDDTGEYDDGYFSAAQMQFHMGNSIALRVTKSLSSILLINAQRNC